MTAGEAAGEAVLRARAYLSRVAEPANVALWAFVDRVGPIAAADAIRRGEAPDEVDAATAARRGRVDVDADLDAAGRHGIRLIGPEDADWPHFALAAMETPAARRRQQWLAGDRAARPAGEAVPPLALWVKGELSLRDLGVRSVGLVGARAATAYGVHLASELGYGLADRGVAVVSGGAYGIDAAAHRGALAAGGATVLVSAGGLDRPYPAGNAALFERIGGEGGLLVSESPPGSAPHRRRFLSRNRVIAALSTGTVVIEAGRRSGALNTAAHARRLGRPVMALPGPVTSAASVGCHDLLRGAEGDGSGAARLVTGVEDVMAEIGAPGEGLGGRAGTGTGTGTEADTDSAGAGARSALDGLDAHSAAVHDALRPRRYATEDELSVISALPVPQVRQALAALLLYELAEAGPEGYRLRPRTRPARGPA